jgi:hypothetical protein
MISKGRLLEDANRPEGQYARFLPGFATHLKVFGFSDNFIAG